MAKLETLIPEFSQRHNIEGLVADEEGCYTMTFDDNLEVRCFEKFDLIHLISTLGNLPEQQISSWLKRLLNYTLMRMKHSVATPTLNEKNQLLLVARFEIGNLGISDFEEKIEQYVNALEEYRHFISQDGSQQSLSANQMVFKP